MFLKIFLGLLFSVVITFTLIVGMFCFDSGRAVLLSGVTKYFEMQNTVFTIKGLDRKISKADEVFIRSADGIELIFSDVTFSRKKLIDRSSIYVTKFVLNGSDDKIDLNAQLKGLIPLMRTLRIFISDLKLGRGYLYKISDEPYYLDNLKYVSKENEDFLYSDINEKCSLDVVFRWDGLRSIAGDIAFKNILGFSGTLIVKNPDAKVSDYELQAKSKNCEIFGNGSYKDFMFDIKIDDAIVNYNGETYNCSGNVFLDNQSAKLSSEIALGKILEDDSYLPESLKDVHIFLNADCRFNGDGTVNAELRDDIATVCELFGKCENKKLTISGDLSQIDFWGYRFANLEAQIDDFKKARIILRGEEAEVSAVLDFEDKLEAKSFEVVGEKGFIKSVKPFLLSKDTDCSFDFNFNQLDFFSNFIAISGNGSGRINYKDGKFSGNAEFGKIEWKGENKLFALKIAGDENNFVCNAQTAKFADLLLHKLNIKKQNTNFEIVSSVNNVGALKANGIISENYKQISLKECEISATDAVLKTNSCNLNFEEDSYDVDIILFSKKAKPCGTAKMVRTPSEWNFSFKGFQAFRLAELLRMPALKFILDGDVKLTATNDCFTGKGQFSLRGVMAYSNVLNVETQAASNGIQVKMNLTKGNDKLVGEALFPIIVLKDGGIIRSSTGGTLSCHVLGNSHLEQLLELTDDVDLKGDLNCDFSVNGTLDNPTVKGFVNLKKAYIAIGDLILKNGNISLIGNGRNISVERADFTDDSSHIATITGSGKLFFDGWRPDIDTKLQLLFKNFTLFDSEEMKIIVDGTGEMSGPIKDMKLTGNINVPKCEIRSFKTDSSSGNEIEVENVAYTGKQNSKENAEEDFFDYNINMHCPQINFSGNVFSVTLSGDLQLVTYLNKTALKGELKLSDGKLNLFGKRMKFVEGNVTFLEEFPFDPKAYLVCRGNFADINVRLGIKNIPNKGVSLKLSSTPSHSEEVILSMMLFGKEMKYLSVAEAAQLAHAVSSINKKGYMLSILNAFQEMGIVDSLSFSSNNSGTTDLFSNTQTSSQNNVNVSAGKYIHDNVYVSVNKKEKETTFDVDLSVTPTMSIKANTAGEVGVSWKYRY